MSNVLFLTSVYDFNEKGNLNVDLIDEFAKHGHNVTVMTPKERKYSPKEVISKHGNITALQFKCLNFRGEVNVIEKGISTLSLGYQYKRAWKKYFRNHKYDIVIYTTMPITYSPIIRYIKKKCGAFCYLQQKDFFPQSAVDLGMLKKGTMLYRLFRRIEIALFKDSDMIGVISPKNIDFILKNNSWLKHEKVEVCPNGIIPTEIYHEEETKICRDEIRKKNSIPLNSIVFLYGGNISRSQGVPFIKAALSRINAEKIDNLFILIIGNGNEFSDLEKHVNSLNNASIRIMKFMPKEEFDRFLMASDVGMVFLDNLFTIANIPSRTLAHMDMAQPIIAATDTYTDYKNMLEDNKMGLWCQSGDVDGLINNIRLFTEDNEIREEYGKNARKYLEEYSNAENAYRIIIKSYIRWKKENELDRG